MLGLNSQNVSLIYNYLKRQNVLKAHCRGAEWVNNTTKKKRIRQGPVILLYSEIHEDDNELIPFILEANYDPRA